MALTEQDRDLIEKTADLAAEKAANKALERSADIMRDVLRDHQQNCPGRLAKNGKKQIIAATASGGGLVAVILVIRELIKALSR